MWVRNALLYVLCCCAARFVLLAKCEIRAGLCAWTAAAPHLPHGWNPHASISQGLAGWLLRQVEHLERRITALEDAVEAQGIEVHSVSHAAQDQAVFVGRICCDTGAAWLVYLAHPKAGSRVG